MGKKSKSVPQEVIDNLSRVAKAATPGAWGHEVDGTQVFVGTIAEQSNKRGARTLILQKGGFFLFDIEPELYAGNITAKPGVDADDETACHRQALADAKFIGTCGPSVVLMLLKEIARLKTQLKVD